MLTESWIADRTRGLLLVSSSESTRASLTAAIKPATIAVVPADFSVSSITFSSEARLLSTAIIEDAAEDLQTPGSTSDAHSDVSRWGFDSDHPCDWIRPSIQNMSPHVKSCDDHRHSKAAIRSSREDRQVLRRTRKALTRKLRTGELISSFMTPSCCAQAMLSWRHRNVEAFFGPMGQRL